MKSYLFSIFFLFIANTLMGNQNVKPEVCIIPTPTEWKTKGYAENMFQFKNFPKNQEINLLFCRVLQKNPQSYKQLEKLKIDDEGVITKISGKMQTKFLVYGLRNDGFFPGEKVSYRFTTRRGKIIGECSYIPKPFEVKSDQGSFSALLEYNTFDPSIYTLSFPGLNENETVKFVSVTEGGCSDITHNRQNKILIIPEGFGPGGFMEYKVIRNTGDSAELKLPWGTKVLETAFQP